MPRRFHLRVFGCQMNQHDAEKISNLLHHEGYNPTSDVEKADLILVHTCSIRDKAGILVFNSINPSNDRLGTSLRLLLDLHKSETNCCDLILPVPTFFNWLSFLFFIPKKGP